MNNIPSGFEPHGRRSPATEAWEPIYSREHEGVVRIGLRLASRHCNSRGFVHGGVIATLTDNAMGLSYGVALRTSEPGLVESVVTVSLSVDYTATAQAGAWLEIVPRVIKAGRSLGFVDALIIADNDIVARATGTFKLIKSR